MSFGLTLTGFVPKSLDDCKTDLEAAFKAAFGAGIDLAPESPYSQVIGIMAERLAELWALAGAVYAAGTADGAAGAQLDDVCAITGTSRTLASRSVVTATATGNAGTVLASGRVASVVTVGTRFETLAPATIANANSWTNSHSYAEGDVVTHSGNIYRNLTAGMSAISGGPSGTTSPIPDGGCSWQFMGVGNGYVDVAMQAQVTGPFTAPAGTLSVIETPVSGWSSVTNFLDATPGANLEADDDLRVKRENELQAAGTSPLEAIRENLLEVEGVTSVTVFENVTDTTDGDGLPPHAVEALVQGGTDAAVRASLFANVAGGIATHGGVTGTVTDTQGGTHEIDFSRPSEIDIYVIINCTVDASLYPADGDAQVQAAIVAFGDLQKTGKDAVASGIAAQAFKVPGMLDAVALIGTAPSPATSVTVAIALRELAVFDTSRISVVSTPGTP